MTVDASRKLKKIAEGREAEIFAWDEGYVLRLLRDAGPLDRLEREAAAMQAARSAGVAVPAVREIITVFGRPGMVMERVDGPDMLTLIGRKPWTVERIGRVSGELQAAVNNVKAPEELRPLRAYATDRINRIPVPPELEHLRRFALDTLEQLPDGDVICHGDYHPGNIIDGKNGPMIIDWPNVSRGDGDADFARTMLTLRIGEPPPGTSPIVLFLAKFARGLLIWGYRRAYLRRRPVDPASVAQWTIVRAADRLWEGIEVERPKLVAFLQKHYDNR